MKIIDQNRLRKLATITTLVSLVGLGLVTFVSYRLLSKTPSLPFIPVPFSSTNEFPRDSFLFVFFEEYFVCSEDLCSCAVSEPPLMPFEFRGDKLLVDRSDLSAAKTDDWKTLRKRDNSILLYSKYSEWDVILRLFPTIPAKLSNSAITVLGINSKGDVNIRFSNEHVVIPVGLEYKKDKFEIINDRCRMVHAYSITNYGFIRDENVEFFPDDRWDF